MSVGHWDSVGLGDNLKTFQNKCLHPTAPNSASFVATSFPFHSRCHQWGSHLKAACSRPCLSSTLWRRCDLVGKFLIPVLMTVSRVARRAIFVLYLTWTFKASISLASWWVPLCNRPRGITANGMCSVYAHTHTHTHTHTHIHTTHTSLALDIKCFGNHTHSASVAGKNGAASQ
jgi:hypothetical protein